MPSEFGRDGARSLSPPRSSSTSAKTWSTAPSAATLEDTALSQIEHAEKKLFDLASAGQTEGGFRPFRAALTECDRRAEAAFKRGGKISGVATGFFDLDSSWAACTGRT